LTGGGTVPFDGFLQAVRPHAGLYSGLFDECQQFADAILFHRL
jgi:hypothetical protein